MVVWQFTTIAALIGAVLIYVMVLTNRLGATNALLKRIEEGLVRPQPVTENMSAPEAEVVPVRAPVPMQRTAVEQGAVEAPRFASMPTSAAAQMEVEEASAAEALEGDRRVSYLTVRDLKVIARSGRRSSDGPVGVSPLFNEVFGRRHAQAELVEAPAEAASHLEVVAVEEPMVASVEIPAVVEKLAAATHEMRDFLEATPSPMSSVLEPEPAITEPAAAEPATTWHAALPIEPVATEPVAVDLATAINEAVVPEPATPEASVLLHPAAANEDQAPAAAPGAATKESQGADAAAREEKRKRDLLMQAYRRRRHR